MKLCVSNIAWETDQDEAAAKILRDHGIDAVETAPTKYWSAPCAPTADDIEQCKQFWIQQGVPIFAMQSLLFGMPMLSIFSPDQMSETQAYLQHIVRIGAALGAQRYVFGSPKNRDRGQFTVAEANRLAADFFRPIAQTAHELGVVFCLEPNPTAYQCNFMTNTAEALAVVDAVDQPGLGLHLDTGIMCMNDESFDSAIAMTRTRLCHFHISHPQLAAVTDNGPVNHAGIAHALKANEYTGLVSVEMRRAESAAQNLVQLSVACDVLNRHYR